MTPWRERAGRAEARPQSVGEVVRRVRASLRATHGLACGLIFVSAALLAWGAGFASGAAGRELFAVALLCAALAAAAWWREHPVELAATAGALDDRLRYDGALITAFELEEKRHGELAAMEELVRERVLTRLRPLEALRALFPSLFVPLAAPVLSALSLILVLDGRRAPAAETVDLARLAAGLDQVLSSVSLDAGSAAPASVDGGLSEQHGEIAALLELGRSLPRTNEEWSEDPAGARERLEAMDRKAAHLAAVLGPESGLGARLAETRAWLDALRMGLPEPGGDPALAESGAGSGLTSGSRDGTIPGSSTSPDGVTTAPDALAPSAPLLPPAAFAPPLGVQAGSFWPAEYDAVVGRWIELSRAAHADGDE